MIFPALPGPRTTLLLSAADGRLPVVHRVGLGDGSAVGSDAADVGGRPDSPLLVEQSRGSFARPGLRGHRLAEPPYRDARDVAGRDWSPRFDVLDLAVADESLVVTARAEHAGLELRTEVESLPGGALRIRHRVTNVGATPYLVEGLEVTLPLPDSHVELLDFTGRHERERVPQRGTLRDGLWLRESRQGRPGLDAASLLIAGTPGFDFGHGHALAVHVASSGNSVLRAERSAAEGATIGGGELLLPGEVVLLPDQAYATPWVMVAASEAGLDPLAHSLHTWQRSLAAHPAEQPVTLNVWEAVYFDHDLATLTRLADLAARVGAERFVLDDGWFHGRRDDTAGLGDWWVDEDVWPDGLAPLIEHVHALGLQFGLWFEPEMINPDSALYRAHPDWILATDARIPVLRRNQLVLDLGNDEVWRMLRDRIDAILSAHRVDYVKWDHNRELLEAGSNQHAGAPAAHRNTAAFYALLDDLRARHPGVAWESCASGGGRVDLGVIERVERFWTSDMTDALARQHIQRWTGQFVAPEYLGAHVSAPISHQTGRILSLDFRAATALFGAFGIEWDLTEATESELAALADWVDRHKRHRTLLHTGRMVRLDVADPAVLAHGVIALDRASALIAHVQLEESSHNRGVELRVPGLIPTARYRLQWDAPIDTHRMSGAPALDPDGPSGRVPMSGTDLARSGVWLPRRRPETIALIHAARID